MTKADNPLHAIRIKMKWNQAELGELLGVKQRCISSYESGEIILPIDKVKTLINFAKSKNIKLNGRTIKLEDFTC